MVADDQEFDLDEPHLLKIATRTFLTSKRNLAKFSEYTSDVTETQIVNNTPDFRMQVFQRWGRVDRTTRMIKPNADTDDPLRRVFLNECRLNEGQPVAVLSFQAPNSWLQQDNLNQPVKLLGFLYGRIKLPGSDQIVPLLISKSIAWYPEADSQPLGVTTAHVYLASQGVDIAGLETIRREHGKRIGRNETEFFYQFLQAVENYPIPVQVPRWQPLKLLANSRKGPGNVVRLEGRIKQVSKVRIPDKSVVELTGLDHYYQVTVFPDLGQDSANPLPVIPGLDAAPPPIEVTDGDQKITYQRFPFTVCCWRLPDGEDPDSLLNRKLVVEGFFYRFWKYESEISQQHEISGQLSPLIIANHFELPSIDLRPLNQLFGSLLFVFLGVVLILGWNGFRVWRRRQTRLQKFKESLPARLSWPSED